jgi:hypothetical protein
VLDGLDGDEYSATRNGLAKGKAALEFAVINAQGVRDAISVGFGAANAVIEVSAALVRWTESHRHGRR